MATLNPSPTPSQQDITTITTLTLPAQPTLLPVQAPPPMLYSPYLLQAYNMTIPPPPPHQFPARIRRPLVPITRDFKKLSPAIYYATNEKLPRHMSHKNQQPVISPSPTINREDPHPTILSFIPTKGPSALANLPTELLLPIIHQLNGVYSTCLALTCKDFYTLHRLRHGSVPLTTFARHSSKSHQLGTLLSVWAGPELTFFPGPPGVFVRASQMPQFLKELEREEERQDRVVRRLVEVDLIEWEAFVWGHRQPGEKAEGFMRRAHSRFGMCLAQCESALASGFEVGWLSAQLVQKEEEVDDAEAVEFIRFLF